MIDPLDRFMEDLPDAVRYPGGRPPRRMSDPVQERPEPVDPSWDASPKIIKRNGVDTEFFTIGALAQALGRKQVTVRSWEDKGWLPKARFRTSLPKGRTLPDKKQAGRRLYTRAQVEAVVAAARATGVLDPEVKSPDWRTFTKMVVDAWRSQ